MDTAGVLAEALGLEFGTDRRLRETDLGEWSGKGHSEVDSLFPGQRSHWRLNPTWAPPGGETRLEVSERAAAVVTDLMSTAWDAGSVMLVAAGGTIGALTSLLLDVPGVALPDVRRAGEHPLVAVGGASHGAGRHGPGALGFGPVVPGRLECGGGRTAPGRCVQCRRR